METALSAALRDRGQRVTPQRLGVARVMGRAERHLTAEQVYDEVGELMPGVSLPTVYATLELLRDLGLVERVPTEGGAVVYDSRTEDHHHLVCRGCGAIVDVESAVGTSGLLDAAPSGRLHTADHAGRGQGAVRGVRGGVAATLRWASYAAKRPSGVFSQLLEVALEAVQAAGASARHRKDLTFLLRLHLGQPNTSRTSPS